VYTQGPRGLYHPVSLIILYIGILSSRGNGDVESISVYGLVEDIYAVEND